MVARLAHDRLPWPFWMRLAADWARAPPAAIGRLVPVGVAVVDVTPAYPIRLMGYGSRKTESEGVASPLKVRALAIGERCQERRRRRARGAGRRRQLRGRDRS